MAISKISSSSASPQPLYPLRRASEAEPNPPRYSTLLGTSPDLTSSIPIATHNDGAISPSPSPPLGPPAYCPVSQRIRCLDETVSSWHLQRAQRLCSSQARNGIYKHHYHINGGESEPWVTLKVYNPSSNSNRKSTPHFKEGDLIRGVFELNLDTPQNINSISLFLRGRITASLYEHGSYTFLEQPITSWDRNDGDPRSMFFTPETVIKKFESKLLGQYTWPFSLAFPKEVIIRGQHRYLSKAYPTPPTFFEDGTKTSVQYDLVLRITHGMLCPDSGLNVDIVYRPDSTPNPFSLLCEAAYCENATTPGPDDDPVGWVTLPNANIHGKLSLFNDRHAHLRCTLSITKPQCYTRGSIIPCHISIHSTSIEALDMLANHDSIRVCLVRRIHLYEDPKQAYSRIQRFQDANGDQVPPGVIEKIETIERAVWWPSNSEEPDTRNLEGEIHLDKELEPSSHFLLFKVSYALELYPFESPGFKCTNSRFNPDSVKGNPKAFMSHPITIATQHRQGQVPVPFTILKPRPQKGTEFPPPEFSFCTA